MTAWDVFFGVLGALLVVMVVRSFVGLVSSGNLAPKDLSDWREYTWMIAVVLIVASWILRSPVLNLPTVGTVASVTALVFLIAHLILHFKTRQNKGS